MNPLKKLKARSYLRHADSARDRKDWAEAQAFYRQYLNEFPRRVPIWIQLGHACKEGGDLASAETAYLRALNLEPLSPDGHLQLGHLYKIKGERDRAIAFYVRAVEIDPHFEYAIEELRNANVPLPKRQAIPVSLETAASRIVDLESKVQTLVDALGGVASQASAINSHGFELARQKRQLEAQSQLTHGLRDWRTDYLRDASAREIRQEADLEKLRQNQVTLLNAVAEARSANFMIAKLQNAAVADEKWKVTNQATLDQYRDQIALLTSRLDDGSSRWDTLVAEHEASQGRIDEVDADCKSLRTALAYVAEQSSQFARAIGGIEHGLKMITERLDEEAGGAAHLTSEAIEVLRSRLVEHFVVPSAIGRQNQLISELDRKIVAIENARPDLELTAQYDHAAEEWRAKFGHLEGLLSQTIDMQSYLTKRIEFVRREILFEMSYGGDRGHASALEAPTQIINLEKFETFKSRMRVNLGCGHILHDDFINVDRRELPGVDVVAEVDRLPFEQGSLSEIYSAHLLEHFPEEELKRSLIPYWLSLLAPAGKFTAIVPDAEAMIDRAAEGSYPFGEFKEVFFGAQDYRGDFHYNMFTPQSLTSLLSVAGFEDVRVVERARRNGSCFEFEITAVAPRISASSEPHETEKVREH